MKKEILIAIIILSLSVIGISSCSRQDIIDGKIQYIDERIKTEYSKICIDECLRVKSSANLSSQCLMNPIPGVDMVCDIAHLTRTAEDNLPENQCSFYTSKQTRHFIEVSPECQFIRIACLNLK